MTVAIQALEQEGVIARRRGRIVITDRKALEKKVRQLGLRMGRAVLEEMRDAPTG